jgi:hypothetical protein
MTEIQGPKSGITMRANLAPPWVGEEYSLTLTPQFSYLWYKGMENLANETSVIRLTHRSFLIQLA